MKFTLNWLKRHLDTQASLNEICTTLTAIGLEVDDLTDRAKEFEPFTVAYVEKAEPHPDADRLKVCTVKTATDTWQVVCGAPNARTGMKGIFAPSGSYIPGLDVTLKKAKIRGVESNGMLVSEKEMCLSDEHKGIIEVDESFEIGTPMADIFGLNDPIIEISLTPNRADCAGVRGIARDLAAAGLGTLKPLNNDIQEPSFASPINVTIEDENGCPYFAGRVVQNIKNGPSPQWFQDLLKAVGLRPISALVDITNFMTMDRARPLHVYDVSKLQGHINVRQAKAGETIDALNDKSYETQGGEIAICDDSGLIGLGGIVGGVSTSVDGNTTSVFIESAYFDPARIARTGRDLGVISDARYRFERGVDPAFTKPGIDIATQLVLEFCGKDKTTISDIVEVGTLPVRAAQPLDVPDDPIEFDPAHVQKLTGVDVPEKRQIEILESLGFQSQKNNNTYTVTPPSWRGDIMGKADLVEEIIRIFGFDEIPSLSVQGHVNFAHTPETLTQNRARLSRSTLVVRGFNECITWSFMAQDRAALFGSNDNPALQLSNPISTELSQMRPSILPNLIESAGRNAAQGYSDVALCEIGPVFYSPKPDGQTFVATGIRSGSFAPRHWDKNNPQRTVDVYDAKADALAVLRACDAPADNAQITRDAPDYYHPGRSGTLRLGKNVLACFGELHPGVLADLDIKFPICGFEVFLENLPQARKTGTEKKLLKLNPLQPVNRDFAFVVPQDVPAEDVLRSVKGADKALITNATIFDVYTGKGVEDGHKSVAVDVTIQPTEETLTDRDLEALTQKITDNVSKRTGGVLRG